MGTIIESVGVAEARRGLRHPSSVELATRAARDAIEAAGCEAGEIGLLINAGVYRDENICEPAIAPFIQRGIGANPALVPGGPTTFSFDVQNGVCGMLTAIQVLDGFLSSGVAKRAMVVASDIDPTPGVSQGIDFAPSGGAILLRSVDGPEGFTAFHSETVGKHSNLFEGHVEWIGEGRSGLSLHLGRNHAARIRQGENYVAQCADCAARAIGRFLETRGLTLADVDLVVPSISPAGFPEALAEGIDAQDCTMPAPQGGMGIPHSAGPALALASAMAGERYRKARSVLLVAAGAGITVALALYGKRAGAV